MREVRNPFEMGNTHYPPSALHLLMLRIWAFVEGVLLMLVVPAEAPEHGPWGKALELKPSPKCLHL